MKEIKLTQGKVALVDDEDFEQLNKFKWYVSKGRNTFYAKRSLWIDGKHKSIFMHREVLNITNRINGDHRNGNGLDNRKENLRLATNQQNQYNQTNARKDNKLGIKGTHWHKASKKFVAIIQINGERIHLGCFNVLGDADSAYRKAEKEYFGEFARNN